MAMLTTPSILSTLTNCIIPPLADDDCDKVTHDSLTAGKSVNSNAGDGNHDPLKEYFMLDTLATWPWPRCLNQYYHEVSAESSAWAASFEAFSPKAQMAFNRCQFSLLACLAYPTVGKEHVRIACDLVNAIYLIDEISEVSDSPETREQWKIITDTLHNPHKPRPEGEWIGGEIIRQFLERFIPYASMQTQKRFVQTLDKYLESLVQHAIDRSEHRIRDIESYIIMRRNTSAILPLFAIVELGLDIPDEVMSHPIIEVINTTSNDLISMDNDMASFNIEQARGDNHNFVTTVMHELDTDINGAMIWIANRSKEVEKMFFEAITALPKWGEPIDSQVRQYCDGVGCWVRGNHEWTFETERYFGNKGQEIKRGGWNTLIPKDSLIGARVIGSVVE